jgi:hypothetical protein
MVLAVTDFQGPSRPETIQGAASMRSLDVVEILSWYDGIVLALVRLSGHEGTFLASLVAWSQALRHRVFVLIPRSETEVEEARRLVTADWNGFMSHVVRAGQRMEGDALFVRADELTNEVFAEAKIHVSEDDARELVVSDAGEALDPSRDRWLKALQCIESGGATVNHDHDAQEATCLAYGVPYTPPVAGLKVGISRNVRDGVLPINGLRHSPEGDTTGWYIWAGKELPDDPDFFVPLHVEHMKEWCPEAIRFLGLPPGWRFLVAGDHEEAWEDPAIVNT